MFLTSHMSGYFNIEPIRDDGHFTNLLAGASLRESVDHREHEGEEEGEQHYPWACERKW